MKTKKNNKAITEMSAKELKEAYIRANKRISHAKKRIKHEQNKDGRVAKATARLLFISFSM